METNHITFGELQLRYDDLLKERDKLKAFKVYVHKRLDEMNIPENPEPENNAKHGCRIEGRLNIIEGKLALNTYPEFELQKLKEDNDRLKEELRQRNEIDNWVRNNGYEENIRLKQLNSELLEKNNSLYPEKLMKYIEWYVNAIETLEYANNYLKKGGFGRVDCQKKIESFLEKSKAQTI